MPSVTDLALTLWRRKRDSSTLVIGLTGGVACGKSTLATALAGELAVLPGRPQVERIGTDGFLLSNATLSQRGVLERKGFPETYDRPALNGALRQARLGPTLIPGYSHSLYDVDPGLARTIARPDVLIVEGLGLDRQVPLDALVYLDADQADQKVWYVARFLEFWELGRQDSHSFYARFREMERDAVAALAAMVWGQVNLPNLTAHIEPVRAEADVVVRKAADHRLLAIVDNADARA